MSTGKKHWRSGGWTLFEPGREEIVRGAHSASDVDSSAKHALRSPQCKHSGFSKRRSLGLRTTPPQKAIICYATSLPPLLARRAPSPVTRSSSPAAVTTETYKARGEMFRQLMEFFPQEAKEPSADLAGVIDWYEEGGD
ncbi:hypothetical protein BJV78DRAFT_1150899 [Lactifluus subvellereus]|nr:hypothetical protein BJV78DRAFT_1150899 [Lactifluus subvellereus]